MPNIKMKKRRVRDRVTLYEELRLVELSETEVNGIWKGAHLLLFFLAFVFGAFCTFCFHMLMYMFDEKCVLYPKLLSLSGTRHSVLYDLLPNKDEEELLPVDFVSTQWGEKSTCYLPTYVPLLSGLFGLVWTTMFLMCSSGGNSLSGFKRSWRIIPSVFLFSVCMSALCIYASSITQWGLHEMCAKLGEITGSTTCTYTINVATLLYDRRIRGVYQAIKLTILSAWLHTCCWILAAVLALVRVLLVVDFGLVRIRAELQGDIDTMLERHEKHIRTVSPDGVVIKDISTNTKDEASKDTCSVIMHFKNESFDAGVRENPLNYSTLSLVPDEEHKLIKLAIINSVPDECKFIPDIVYKLIDNVVPRHKDRRESIKLDEISEPTLLTRQKAKEVLNRESYEALPLSIVDNDSDESNKSTSDTMTTSSKTSKDENKPEEIVKKTILKTRSVQTDGKDKKATQYQKVLILESGNVSPISPGTSSDETLKPDGAFMVAEQTNLFDFSEQTHNVEVQTGISLILENEQVEENDNNFKIETKATENQSNAIAEPEYDTKVKNEEQVRDKYKNESNIDEKEIENKQKITSKTSEEDTQTTEGLVQDDEDIEVYKVFEPKKTYNKQTQVNEEDLKQEHYVKKSQDEETQVFVISESKIQGKSSSKENEAKEDDLKKEKDVNKSQNEEIQVSESLESETQGTSSSKENKHVQATPKEKQD